MDKELELAKQNIEIKRDRDKERLKDNPANSIDCKLCEETFDRFVDLESHMKSSHEKHQTFQCDKSEKGFVIKWRLKKHMRLHIETDVKTCHYFNNEKKILRCWVKVRLG